MSKDKFTLINKETGEELLELNTAETEVPKVSIEEELAKAIDEAVLTIQKHCQKADGPDGTYHNPYLLWANQSVCELIKINKHKRAKIDDEWYRVITVEDVK